MTAIAVMVALAVVVVSTANASTHETARAFTVRVWALNSDARYGEMWMLMHPAQQRLLKKTTFIECEQRSYGPARDDDVTVTGTRSSSIAISGTGKRVAGVAVSFILTDSHGKVYGPFIQGVAKVDGMWRWIMRGDDFRACPVVARRT